ncbi:MAG: polysaccharide deacetylase family protein [Pyrinomonadaceae bacterium]
MNRREFAGTLGMGAIAFSLGRGERLLTATSPQVAITMDDFNWSVNTVRLTGDEQNFAILRALREHSLKAALFVRTSNIEDNKGKTLLRAWDTAGHLIGNHTYSHWSYNNVRTTSAAFEQDILRSEELLKDFPRFKKLFRFPYLKEGNTATKRDAIRSFLAKHGYHTGHVTIDASDWIVDDRLCKRLTKEPAADLAPYRDFYLAHMWDRALYYDDLSRKVLGRSVKHTILIHFNLLNALFVGDLMQMFKNKGWQLIDAEDAFTDPVFAAKPNIVPAGESIIWALAKEAGKFDQLLRYPGEDGDYETAKMDKLGL